jgi:hypothetical protein
MFRFLSARALLPLIGVMYAASLTPASAGLEIQLQSGGTTITQTGASPLMVSQAIGGFTVTVNTGTMTSVPSLDLSSIEMSNDAGGTLVVTLSANGFTSPTGSANWLSQFSGNFVVGAATVTLQTFLDSTNTLLGTATSLSTLSPASTPFGLQDVASASTLAPFALTEILTITTQGATHLSFDASIVEAPEPASLFVAGTAFVSLGALRRRRRAR